jgi:diacylglycerol kinase family enzyme
VSTVSVPPTTTPPGRRQRLLALAALACLALAVVVAVAALRNDVARVMASVIVLFAFVLAGWRALTRRRASRLAAVIVAGILAGAELVLLFTGDRHGLVPVVVGLLAAGSVALARPALETGNHPVASGPPGEPVPPARHGVLIMNLRSGGGKAETFGLEEECRRRGIEPVVLRPGDDLRELAVAAVERGADVLGMAGGDGSQALVASVAAEHGVPHVCVPAGTRNHFALDVGLDRNDVVGALDAFGPALERRVDLATVNGRVFVNNVSLGVYARVVQAEGYREAKRQTTTALLPEMLGPGAAPFDLSFTGPDGQVSRGSQLIQVSNNPYVLTRLGGGFGTRARVDTGNLGVAAVHVRGDADVARFVALESTGRLSQFPGWREWATPSFQVDSGAPVEAGVDGEALVLDPPLEFRCLAGVLRLRIPTHAPGHSPAARKADSLGDAVRSLARVVAGRADDRQPGEPEPAGDEE